MKFWCESHNRVAASCRGCDPRLGGVMLPCKTVPIRFGWKIVRQGPAGHWRTLYKGLHGRRNLPLNSWLVAERKIAREGSGHHYTTGWHVLPEDTSEKTVAKYLKRFTATNGLELAAVAYVGGEKKPGRTSVWLAEYLFVTSFRTFWGYVVGLPDEDRRLLLQSVVRRALS